MDGRVRPIRDAPATGSAAEIVSAIATPIQTASSMRCWRLRTSVRSAKAQTAAPSPAAVVGSRSDVSIETVVDLPEPFGPSSPSTWPRATVKFTSRTAGIPE